MPDGPHCLRCKHHEACLLPQKAEGHVCGWYNARVRSMLERGREAPRHHLTSQARAISTRPAEP